MKDIIDTLNEEGSFTTLISALGTADLTEMLRKPGPLTLFAPNDQAFTRIKMEEVLPDRGKLIEMLTYHIVEGSITAAGIADEEHILTNCGKSLTVHLKEGRQEVDNAAFIRTDIECTNGIIHIIDNVFLPNMSGWYCGSCC